MKTLKTIFILLALVCANSSFAQTQEETIAWIKEKLEKHGISEDTGIEVLFLVIDKEKTSPDVYREIYDAKSKKVVHTDGCQLSDDYHWETPREPQVKEEIDIDAVNKELDDLAVNHLEKHLMSHCQHFL